MDLASVSPYSIFMIKAGQSEHMKSVPSMKTIFAEMKTRERPARLLIQSFAAVSIISGGRVERSILSRGGQ